MSLTHIPIGRIATLANAPEVVAYAWRLPRAPRELDAPELVKKFISRSSDRSGGWHASLKLWARALGETAVQREGSHTGRSSRKFQGSHPFEWWECHTWRRPLAASENLGYRTPLCRGTRFLGTTGYSHMHCKYTLTVQFSYCRCGVAAGLARRVALAACTETRCGDIAADSGCLMAWPPHILMRNKHTNKMFMPSLDCSLLYNASNSVEGLRKRQ